MSILLDRWTHDFHQCAAASVELSQAHVGGSGGTSLSVWRSVRHWEQDGRHSYLYHFGLQQEQEQATVPTQLDASMLIRLPSPSGRKLLIVKKHYGDAAKQKETPIVLELWEGSCLVRRLEATLHGPILQDPTGFGCPEWSPDESCIVYPAQRKNPPTSAFWSQEEPSPPRKDERIRGGTSVLGQGRSEHWGEKLSEQSPLLDLYVLDTTTGRIGRVENVPTTTTTTTSCTTTNSLLEGVTLGQPAWHPNGHEIAYTGWDAGGLGSMPRRLGMIFCRNRPSQVYRSNVSNLLQRLASPVSSTTSSEEDDEATTTTNDDAFHSITSPYKLSRSPRFVTDGDTGPKLIFLSNPEGFVTHEGVMGLYEWDEASDSVRTILPVVQTPYKHGAKSHDMGFPGLFLSQLPSQCSLGEGKFVVLTTLWGCALRLVRIERSTGEIALVKLETISDDSSISLLCQGKGKLILSESSSNRPVRLWSIDETSILQTPRTDGSILAPAKLISTFAPLAASSFSAIQPAHEPPFSVQILSVAPPAIDGATDEPIQAIVLIPNTASSDNKVPLVVVPHGGPHSASTLSYTAGLAYLASSYAVVLPNYRGSIGFGQASLECLMTRVGTVDVQDVMKCTEQVLAQFADVVDKRRIGICGGSHGGFLTAHCTGQYPNFFRAAVMRNPVTNIATMTTATDIADWCYAEALGTYDFSRFRGATADELAIMYEKSPIVHVAQVKTPTLVALGLVDLRVPPSQGKEWYYTLRSSGVDTKLLEYPEDSHALDKVSTEADHWIQIKLWFEKYFSEKKTN